MVLVTGSSMLVPIIGLATAPILSHALGVAGRGQAGAAMAPNLLIVGGATLGLPNALTYYLAKRPGHARAAVAWATVMAVGLGGVTLAGLLMASNYLSGDDPGLAHLMVLGAWLAIPALVVGLLRGAAAGRQMWTAVALERAVNSLLRLVLLASLAFVGRLDVTSAVLVMCIAPVVAGVTYARVCCREETPVEDVAPSGRVASTLLRYGSQVWLGSVATMLMARLSQLLVVPLSNAEQLGLLIVAITISDVPYIVTQTVREVAFGTNSADSDTKRLLTTSRIATLVAVVGSFVLGAALPWWIGVVFGSGFRAAVVPTWLLLASSCISVPGLIAGAGLDSAGRPVLRSASLIAGLIATALGLLLLVPPFGAMGAALAALISTGLSTAIAVIASSRILGVRSTEFFLPRHADLEMLRRLGMVVLRRLRKSQSAQ